MLSCSVSIVVILFSVIFCLYLRFLPFFYASVTNGESINSFNF